MSIQGGIGITHEKEAIVLALDEVLRQKKIEELIDLKGKIKLLWTQKSLKKYRG